MPEPDLTKTMPFASSEDLSNWLKENHENESELWIKVFKKKSGVPSVSWNDIVTETLCWGWIDGVKKSLDDRPTFNELRQGKPEAAGLRGTQNMWIV